MRCKSKQHSIRFACVLAALLGFPLAVFAAKPKITGASVDPTNRSILHVLFDSPAPTAASLQDKGFWIVYQKTTAASARILVAYVHSNYYHAAFATLAEYDQNGEKLSLVPYFQRDHHKIFHNGEWNWENFVLVDPAGPLTVDQRNPCPNPASECLLAATEVLTAKIAENST